MSSQDGHVGHIQYLKNKNKKMVAVVFGTEEKYEELCTASYAPKVNLSSLWTAHGHDFINYPYRGKTAARIYTSYFIPY